MNIIVSGASKGIGKAICKELSNKGHHVIAIARNRALLNNLGNSNENIQTVCADLLNREELNKRLIPMIEKLGKVDAIVNNAGQLINKSFLDTTPSEFMDQYNANVIGAVNLIQLTFSYLSEKSHIVNISSMGGVQGSSKYPGLSAYSASKGAMAILSECMAEEFKQIGVSVNALALGAVQTEMLLEAFPGFEAPTSPEEMAEYIANFVVQGHKFINGKVIPVALANP